MSNHSTGEEAPKREQWSGRLGFILATAGSAVGLGNIMKFPYMTGMNGGAAFLIVYIIVMLVVGVGMLICDFLIGRHGKANAVASYPTMRYSAAGCFITLLTPSVRSPISRLTR